MANPESSVEADDVIDDLCSVVDAADLPETVKGQSRQAAAQLLREGHHPDDVAEALDSAVKANRPVRNLAGYVRAVANHKRLARQAEDDRGWEPGPDEQSFEVARPLGAGQQEVFRVLFRDVEGQIRCIIRGYTRSASGMMRPTGYSLSIPLETVASLADALKAVARFADPNRVAAAPQWKPADPRGSVVFTDRKQKGSPRKPSVRPRQVWGQASVSGARDYFKDERGNA